MQSKQAGGIVSFIIVAVALAGLLAGGLYLSKQQGRSARNNDTSTPQVSEVKNDQKKTEESEAQNDATPPVKTAPTTSGAPRSDAPTPVTTQAGRTSSTTNRVAATGPSGTLPATGPAETSAAIFIITILAFVGYRHVQSRRDVRRAALRR